MEHAAIQNNELKAQVNTITKPLEVEREKTAALEQTRTPR